MNGNTHIADLGDGLYVGGWLSTKPSTINSLGITSVVSMGAAPVEPNMNKVQFMSVTIDDTIQSAPNLWGSLGSILNYIHSKLINGGKCLVHCSSGKSRSVTVVTAYLMKYRKMTLKDARNFILLKRPQALPNEGFCELLELFEETLL